MKFRGTSTIIVTKGKDDEYFLSMECSNCKDVQVLEGIKDTIDNYNDVKELVKSFIDDECLCLECFMQAKERLK